MEKPGKLPYASDETPNRMMLRAVGTIKNMVKKPFLIAGDRDIEMQGAIDDIRDEIRESHHAMSEIVIKKAMTQLLDGIEHYSHLVVLYWAHKVPESSRILTRVHPMGRKENPLVGIFCTCSPARPNPVLMSVVRLRGKKKNILHVSGLDAVDGSPVIDIKPYVKEFYPQMEVRIPDWMQKLCKEMKDCYE